MKNYLKDIFIHLDGVIMAPIYELISHNQNFNDNKNAIIFYENNFSSTYCY